MLYSPAVFAQAEGKTTEQEPKTEGLQTAPIQEMELKSSSSVTIPPRISEFYITPNPAQHGQRVGISYKITGTPEISIKYTLNNRYITKEDLLSKLNDTSIHAQWSAEVAIYAENRTGQDCVKVKFYKFAKPQTEL